MRMNLIFSFLDTKERKKEREREREERDLIFVCVVFKLTEIGVSESCCS
jgi:hypothetical protein